MLNNHEAILFSYLIDRLMKSPNRIGFVTLAEAGNRVGLEGKKLLQCIKNVEKWFDDRHIPSPTCLLRAYPRKIEEVIYDDVFFTHAENFPFERPDRQELDRLIYPKYMVDNEVVPNIYTVKYKDGRHAFDFYLDFDKAVKEKNFFEHDRVLDFFLKENKLGHLS